MRSGAWERGSRPELGLLFSRPRPRDLVFPPSQPDNVLFNLVSLFSILQDGVTIGEWQALGQR